MKHSDNNAPHRLTKFRHLDTGLCATLLTAWVLIASIIPNVWLSMTEPLSAIEAAINVVLPLGVYMLLMSISRHVGRTSLWMVTVMFFAAFQMVLLYMYGRSVIAVDMFLNVVTTNPAEVSELLGNMFAIILAVVLIYLTPIVAAIVAVVGRWRLPLRAVKVIRRSGWALSVLGAVGLVIAVFTSVPPYNALTDIFPLNALYNAKLAVDRTLRLGDYPETSASYTFDARSTRPDSVPEIYIAVVGETSRADNWQLDGYERPTTPRLMALEGVTSFRRALSQSNTTHKSVPMLLSALDATNFGDSIYVSKSLITAFREAGFHTAFLSNQNRNHSFIDRFGEEADTCIFIGDDADESSRKRFDTDLLGYVDKQLAEGHNKQLIVLHTYGSHFSYIDRYPQSKAVFRPDGPVEAIPECRTGQINAYDNTIVLADDLLASLAARLAQTGVRAAMIYTSDHGEDIFDDERRLFLHASPCPSYYQIHVPFVVWLSPTFATAHPDAQKALAANRERIVASSEAYFHTLLDLAGIESPRLRRSASVADSAYALRPIRYLDDHNHAVTLDEAGLLEPDFAKLDSIGIKSKLLR